VWGPVMYEMTGPHVSVAPRSDPRTGHRPEDRLCSPTSTTPLPDPKTGCSAWPITR